MLKCIFSAPTLIWLKPPITIGTSCWAIKSTPSWRVDLEKSKCILLESFTEEERDQIVEYLKDRYGDRLESINSGPMDLPIPLGLPSLSSIPGGKTIGFIHFETIPKYTLPFPVHGFYDLAQHKPLVEGGE